MIKSYHKQLRGIVSNDFYSGKRSHSLSFSSSVLTMLCTAVLCYCSQRWIIQCHQQKV